MAIRKQLNARQMDVSPEMRNLLMRNGMQAHIIANGSGYQLAVQGHDSPLLTYNINEKQMLALTDWGMNYANKTEGVSKRKMTFEKLTICNSQVKQAMFYTCFRAITRHFTMP